MNKLLVQSASAALLALSALLAPAASAQSFVCAETSLGNFCIQLFDDVAPRTVQNFLKYVSDGDYNNTVVHRSVPGFVVQAGGYSYTGGTSATQVPRDPPVVNEYNRSNLRGTIAMAKLGNDPNSATSEWFVNLVDNTSLDTTNGGFTVFGEVIGNGMAVFDAIAARPPRDLSFSLGQVFSEVPLLKLDNQLTPDDFISISRMYQADPNNLPDDTVISDTTAIFNGSSFALPVLYRGVLYRMIFDLTSTPPSYEFSLRTQQIVLLKDLGQDRAVFGADNILTIPSIAYGTTILRNLKLQLIDAQNPKLRLLSFEAD